MCKTSKKEKQSVIKKVNGNGHVGGASLSTGTVIVTSGTTQTTILPSQISITVPETQANGEPRQLTIIEKYPLFRARTALIVRYVEIYSNQVRAQNQQMTPKESVALAQRTWPKIAEQVNKAFPQLKALNSNQAMTIYSIFIQAKTKLEAERHVEANGETETNSEAKTDESNSDDAEEEDTVKVEPGDDPVEN